MNTKEALAGLIGRPQAELEAEPPCRLEFNERGGYIDAAHNVFHWADERLSYDRKMDRAFVRFSNRSGDWLCNDMKAFALKASNKPRCGITNCYTGSCDNMLSHNMHFYTFDRGCEEYVILQVERPSGRMSHAVVFQTGADWSIYDFATGSIAAQDDGEPGQPLLWGGEVEPRLSRWRTENGGHTWQWDNDSVEVEIPNLDHYTISKLEEHRGDREHIFVDPDGVGYCPILGEPLNLWYY